MNFSFVKIALLGLLFAGPAGGARAQDSPPPEYQVKAAFLYNFARFVEWPAGTFAGDAPLTIGILGERGEKPFGAHLENIIKGRTINGRPLAIKHFSSPADPGLKACQIVFICRSKKGSLGKVREALKGRGILTVSDLERLPPGGGGMINFVMEENKVRFEINDAAAKQAGLKISSKLLSLAKNKGKGE